MEISKQDYELFLQFKQFMDVQGLSPTIQSQPKKSRREKGTGTIVKLSGKRKRPYLASITTGYDKYTGKQLQTSLAYFIERKHAEKALDIYLLEKDGRCAVGTVYEYIYNVDGKISKGCTLIQESALVKEFDGNKQKIKDCPTFEEIWQKLLYSDLSYLSTRTLINYKVSFNHFEPIHKRRIDDVTLHDIQPFFDKLMSSNTSYEKMNKMKIVLNHIFKYAIKYDYIEKNYASHISFKETLEDKKNKIPFSKELIKELFENDDNIIVQSILVMIYTGMRPSELLTLKKENVHIDKRYMIGGIKTSNGINRIIPIHECIVKYVQNIIDSSLMNQTYSNYLIKFNVVKKNMRFECTPHSGRHTFATLANEYNLDEFLTKKILGHSARDLTKDVYTHVDTERLIAEINKIPNLS